IAANERADAFVLFRERLICVLKLEQKRRYRCKVRIGIWMHIYEFAFDCTEAAKSEAALALETSFGSQPASNRQNQTPSPQIRTRH
ncbi:hypothetical protein, partial [Sutterella massiliensis]|uniref:hypothetical protein n=1 Tax=Sutterella massiliensis TaxID=1816689 RepID=UPI001961E828